MVLNLRALADRWYPYDIVKRRRQTRLNNTPDLVAGSISAVVMEWFGSTRVLKKRLPVPEKPKGTPQENSQDSLRL